MYGVPRTNCASADMHARPPTITPVVSPWLQIWRESLSWVLMRYSACGMDTLPRILGAGGKLTKHGADPGEILAAAGPIQLSAGIEAFLCDAQWSL